jgi:hypothetical protein
MKRSGFADLPLHGGSVPAWLAQRMTRLGTAIAENVIHDYGRSAFLSKLSDPFWFQAFGTVLGMDWHSSGITTSVLGALKRGLNPRSDELGLFVCGGRGRHSRKTPQELLRYAEKTGLNGDSLVHSSRLAARVDNNAIQDGFQLYLHGFVVTTDGEWSVVQQGMNADNAMARRYHWHSASVRDFTSEPHTAIVGEHQGTILNLVDARSKAAQQAMLQTTRENPEKNVDTIRRLVLPAHHEVRSSSIDLKRLGAVLAVAHEREFSDFASLLLLEKLGPRTLQSLALVAEVVHGAPVRFSDPARFSFAHGGKDRHPFPVPLRVYDQTIRVLKSAVQKARLGREEELAALRRLDAQSRRLEQSASGPSVDALIAGERHRSAGYGGRSVFGWEPAETTQPVGNR